MTRLFNSMRDGVGMHIVLIWAGMAYLLIFSAFPLFYNIIMSFQTVDIFSIASFDRPFVGLKNYTAIFDNPSFWPILKNTAFFVGVSVLMQIVLGFGLALLFAQDFPGSGYMRGLFLAGWIMPGLVTGAIWNWILAGDFGVLNYALRSLGIISTNIFWLSDPAYSLYSIIIANIWVGIPFNMILLSVGLASIPHDIYEAAELDGAGAFRRFLTITLPLMRTHLAAVVSLGVIFTMQQFDLFAALTQGGPSNSSNVMQYWSWQFSFQTYDISSGSAISVLLIVLVVAVAATYTLSTRSEQIN
jgi:multiple sugar transport system permease protein